VSPTAPTFGTLNDQLAKAHRRIRELEARETELLAHNRTLCAVIRCCFTATKTSSAVVGLRQASRANSYHDGI
jgi:hypothetical protein